MNSGVKPQELMKQMVGNVNPQQMQTILTQASSMGVPKDILSQIQNMR